MYEFVAVLNYQADSDADAARAVADALVQLDREGDLRFALRNAETKEAIDLTDVLR